MKTRSKATQILRAMLARRYGFGASPNKQRPGLCGHGGIACHLAAPPKMAQKNGYIKVDGVSSVFCFIWGWEEPAWGLPFGFVKKSV